MITQEQHDTIRPNLPELSGRVYTQLLEGLYAEPGFTDVDVKDLAQGTGLTVEQVKGAIGYLHQIGLTYTDDYENFYDGRVHRQELIGAVAHREDYDYPENPNR